MKKWDKRNPFGENYPHLNEGHNYALDIAHGKIVSCDQVKKACRRYFKDLRDDRFFINCNRAERAIMICSALTHIKGKLAGTLITYEPWQKFIFLSIFGFHWKHNGFRRFTRVYIEVARKNGKSLMLSAIAIYMTFFDGEAGAEGYSAATKEDQAKIVWDVAKAMLLKSPRLMSRAGIECGAKSIFQTKTNSFYKAVGSDSKTQDGYNPHFVVLDELHAHKNSGMWDIMESALGARDEPIMFSITTAGFNTDGICYIVRDEVEKILNDDIQDDSIFGIIFTLDKNDSFSDRNVWIKANPNIGISVKYEYLESMVRTAANTPSKKNNILTKNFNKWVSGGESFFDMDSYDECKEDFNISDFVGESAISGVDLSQKIDLCCTAYIFKKFIDGENHYYFDVESYIPEGTLNKLMEDKKDSAYEKWINEGVLNEIPGPTIDDEIIEGDIIDKLQYFNIKELGYDPWGATIFAKNLKKKGLDICEVGQRVSNFSEPMKLIDKLIREKRFHHNGNTLVRWAFGNVCAKVDKKENVFPYKLVKSNKIDPFIAVLIAFVRLCFYEEEVESSYEEDELYIF